MSKAEEPLALRATTEAPAKVSEEAVTQAAGALPDELPGWLVESFQGRISEATYREMRAEHVASEVRKMATFGIGWIANAAQWLDTAEAFDPPYGSRHHINGILARALGYLATLPDNGGGAWRGPAQSQALGGKLWSYIRGCFGDYADRYKAADRHEMAAAIADGAARDFTEEAERLFAPPSDDPPGRRRGSQPSGREG